MINNLQLLVEISSYDANELQKYVAARIKGNQTETSVLKNMPKRIVGNLVEKIPHQAELQLALHVLNTSAVNRRLSGKASDMINKALLGPTGVNPDVSDHYDENCHQNIADVDDASQKVVTIDRFACELQGDGLRVQLFVREFALDRLLACKLSRGNTMGMRFLRGIQQNISEEESYQLLEYLLWWTNEHRVYQLAIEELQKEEDKSFDILRRIRPHVESVKLVREK